jgi:hypothetical protein
MIAAAMGNLGAMLAMLLHPLYAAHAPPAGLTDLVAAGAFSLSYTRALEYSILEAATSVLDDSLSAFS